MRTFNLLLAVTALTGCVYRIPIVVPAPRCEPNLALQPCMAPVTIKEGSTYSELLTDYQTDRQSLQSCALEQEYLQKAIATCNSIIEEHNQKLQSKQGETSASR